MLRPATGRAHPRPGSWVSHILAYALWTSLLKRHVANRVAPFSLAVPVVGISAGMLVFGDTIGPWQWAGTVLLAGALATVMFAPRRVGKYQH
jgi:O-acetylserine/cysteine efflux transporter